MTRGDRTIVVVTGTRAEYGLLQSSMEAIRDHEHLDLRIVATGMHLSPQHGYTVDEIRSDGFDVSQEVEMLISGDSGIAMAKSLGLGILSISDSLRVLDPDMVLVLGDRDEAFAAGVAAAHMNIPVGHIHGGDAMRGAIIDDSIRHALTKFAHLHFPATEKSQDRILKMGEEPWRVTTVGAPGLDHVHSGDYDDPDAVLSSLGLDPEEPILLVLQHPVTTMQEKASEQMEMTLDAVASVDAQRVLIYPNSDAGGEAMIEAIEGHDRIDGFLTLRNLPRRQFLGLLAVADVLVGNSSSGIIEAPTFGLPVVDVGPRQDSRERTENVVSVPHATDQIRIAVESCLGDEAILNRAEESVNPYDRGGAAERIVEVLASIPIDDELLRKELTY